MKHLLIWMPLLVMALFMVLFGGALVKEAPKPVSPMVGQTVPEMTLHALEESNAITLQQHYAGQPYLMNLFASWCQPCLVEHPLMMQLSQSDVTLLGVAWKDTPADAQSWLSLHGNPYSFTAQDPHGSAAVALGISGVPETFLIDAEGMIRAHWQGPLTDVIINEELLPLWNSLHDAPAS